MSFETRFDIQKQRILQQLKNPPKNFTEAWSIFFKRFSNSERIRRQCRLIFGLLWARAIYKNYLEWCETGDQADFGFYMTKWTSVLGCASVWINLMKDHHPVLNIAKTSITFVGILLSIVYWTMLYKPENFLWGEVWDHGPLYMGLALDAYLTRLRLSPKSIYLSCIYFLFYMLASFAWHKSGTKFGQRGRTITHLYIFTDFRSKPDFSIKFSIGIISIGLLFFYVSRKITRNGSK